MIQITRNTFNVYHLYYLQFFCLKFSVNLYFFITDVLYFWCVQVGLDVESELETTYRTLLTKMPQRKSVLEDAYEAIQVTVKEFQEYVEVSMIY